MITAFLGIIPALSSDDLDTGNAEFQIMSNFIPICSYPWYNDTKQLLHGRLYNGDKTF